MGYIILKLLLDENIPPPQEDNLGLVERCQPIMTQSLTSIGKSSTSKVSKYLVIYYQFQW